MIQFRQMQLWPKTQVWVGLIAGIFGAWSNPILGSESYLDNGVVKVGVELTKGGSITYLSKSGTNDNVINNHDLGRQIQQSYYSGPQSYNPSNQPWKNPWINWPWNPIQTGDTYGNSSVVLGHTNTGHGLYVKCRPQQWALNNVPGECTFESWITLANNVITVSNRLLNFRTDTTEQFSAQNQELPAVYTIGRLYRLFSYAGTAPFTGGPLTNFPTVPPPWQNWSATESWAALVDTNGWGLGVYHPGVVAFAGGFAGTPGTGGPNDNPTGYISPNRAEILDSNIEYTYSYQLILGTLQEIRAWVYAQPYRPGADFRFCCDRQHWSYLQASDSGWPINGWLRVSLASNDPTLVSPFCAYPAASAPKLYVRAAFHIANPAGRATGQLFWMTSTDAAFSEARSYRFPITADGQFRTYQLNLAASNNYSGLITRLRLDPAYNGQTGDYADIAWISSAPVGTNEPARMPLLTTFANGALTIQFSSVNPHCVGHEGKQFRYDLESRTNLQSGAWQPVPGLTNIAGDGTTKTLTNPPDKTAAFYRIRLKVQ